MYSNLFYFIKLLVIMAPGRCTTRSIAHAQQDGQVDESNTARQQPCRPTRSTIHTQQASQQPNVCITRSTIHVLPPRPNAPTTRSTTQGDPPEVSIPPIFQSQ